MHNACKGRAPLHSALHVSFALLSLVYSQVGEMCRMCCSLSRPFDCHYSVVITVSQLNRSHTAARRRSLLLAWTLLWRGWALKSPSPWWFKAMCCLSMGCCGLLRWATLTLDHTLTFYVRTLGGPRLHAVTACMGCCGLLRWAYRGLACVRNKCGIVSEQ